MRTRLILHIGTILAAIITVISCVYPFNANIGGTDGRLVVEGDVLIGEDTKIDLSYVSPLSNNSKEENAIPNGDVWVESEDGIIYRPYDHNDTNSEFTIDLKNASPDVRYRLHISNKDNGHEYITPWSEVCKEPVIDSLSYIPDSGKKQMEIALSMHCTGNSHFRWTYTENWEYHTFYYSYFEYLPPVRGTDTWNHGYGVVKPFVDGNNIYYCWGKHDSSEIMIFSTASQSEDRFVDLDFHSVPQDSKKLQMLYYIEVKLEAMTESCYKYWNNLLQNSDYQGSIFAPNPSEMSGNIRCVTDTTECVIGYINFAQRAVSHLYIDNNQTKFYDSGTPKIYPTPTGVNRKEWYYYYQMGWIPVNEIIGPDIEHPDTSWVISSCADCRKEGGTKNKPDFWPRGEK